MMEDFDGREENVRTPQTHCKQNTIYTVLRVNVDSIQFHVTSGFFDQRCHLHGAPANRSNAEWREISIDAKP